ncbi:uncharacterized protein CMU_027760 [Cryptosporidium muris RN66]|uniref:Acetyl-coenzyme A transporter 1 n=1 Tax=Cryptosporidium muris (strain RN66) TaxID=441375 RepID=B6ABL4_CRYMR|nr:uncharacterized protein CMU_027760 [Cryptosporidium muris RN66]EEA05766.1 hypothetical protein, conserved [Cryptosporidium muris RN66]|eukprot:XP_002140115.1 hypothetical protein [Cryptosporidium muris RN66]
MLFDDLGNVIYLITLYTLQGLPIGLSSSIPFILQGRISYKEQSIFSMVTLPFSLKLLWAPLVDSVYIERIGRRKTWIIPTQLLCSILMIGGSYYPFLPKWLGEGELNNSKIVLSAYIIPLSLYFSILFLLMATQDIAVDAWAVTMLSPKNKGLASTCNVIGQSLGYILAYLGFLFLNDIHISNKYIRPLINRNNTSFERPICEMSEFVFIWGIIIFIVTICTAVIKKEEYLDNKYNYISKINNEVKEESIIKQNKKVKKLLSIKQAYILLYKVILLRPVMLLILLLSIIRIPFAVTDASSTFKLLEYGMSKSDIMLVSPIMIPFSVLTPIFLVRFTKQKHPLKIMNYILPMKLITSIMWCALLIWSRYIFKPWIPKISQVETPFPFYLLFLILSVICHILSDVHSLVFMTYFNIIADTKYAGTYITLFNTISNLGYKWSTSFSIWLLDYTNIRICSNEDFSNNFNRTSWDYSSDFLRYSIGEKCSVDSYFVQSSVCIFLGIMGIFTLFPHIFRILEEHELSDWTVKIYKEIPEIKHPILKSDFIVEETKINKKRFKEKMA